MTVETSPSQADGAVAEPLFYLAVGMFRRPHGVRGDILFTVLTDFPERLRPGTLVYVGEEKRAFKIIRRRPHNDGLLLGFEGITTPEQAARYTGKTAFVRADDRPPLPEGEYYHHQILGLNVFDENGQSLGVVTDILETGANDVYVVKTPEGRELLLPAIHQVILEIDLEHKVMKVHLLPGLE
ncbi:MAG: ribosome maturation factor RimM [Anaerolineales bacterium]|nr:ribosome maturation factor RimM [Anaerolineales bacterium]MCX7756015.1 ribosome maturation factor RimM [Anaerolineales bacterium]MDW8277023.1 ribosome maturation factor RimM [Anaerolineales bacterium]